MRSPVAGGCELGFKVNRVAAMTDNRRDIGRTVAIQYRTLRPVRETDAPVGETKGQGAGFDAERRVSDRGRLR